MRIGIAGLVVLGLMPSAAAAESCYVDHGKQAMFGSTEQLRSIQELAKRQCQVVGISFDTAGRDSVLVADLAKGEMIRIKKDATGSRWESWTGFSRMALANDDPADGIDVGTLRTSRGDEKPPLTKEQASFLRTNKVAGF